MNDFKKLLGETKTQLKNFITKDTPQEIIKQISDIDKSLDNLDEAYTEKCKENETLKDNLIESVKSTGFKINNSQKENDLDQNQRSMDQILDEELEKIIAKQK